MMMSMMEGGGGGADTVLVYLRKDLTTILKLCTRKQGDLKEMCLASLKDFTECADAEALMGTGDDATSPVVVRAVEALIKACETHAVQMVTPAIDGLHKLMAFGFIRGGTTLKDTKTPLIGAALEAISHCTNIQDPIVHLQILKACLTAATTPACDLHRASLMCAVKTCYNIYLVSTTPLNATTARANLRQIINYVFGKFETEMALKPAKAAASEDSNAIDSAGAEHRAHNNDNDDDDPSKEDPDGDEGNPELLHDDYEVSFVDCFLLFRALCKLSSRKLSQGQELASLSSSSSSSAAERGQSPLSPRAVVSTGGIGGGGGGGGAPSGSGQAVESKVLALSLLFDIVESSGPALRTNTLFIEKAIRRHLCSIIVQNGVSTNPRVLKYTLSIFHSLMRNFKSALKTEIGVFFSNIFLRVLESPNSTLQQKWLILQLLHHICEDPQILAEMYINYDCDLRSNNVFCRMVEDICKIAQSHSPDAWVTPEQDLTLKTLALDCLVRVMKSLVDWTEEGKEQLRAYQLQLEKHEIDAAKLSSDSNQGKGGNGEEKEKKEEEKEEKEGEHGNTDEKEAEKKENGSGEEGNGEEGEIEFIALQKQRKTMLEDIREKWALDSKRAIEHMRKAGVIDESAESLAKFLRETEGLDKKATGEYIGGSKPFNKDVLKAYVALFNFAGMELDEALRFFLGQFLLPGEGQVVDRIMENFGQRYYLDNAESKRFEDADAVYKLSFAIIMLATDIHNPKVKNKLTFEQWEKMVNKDLAMGLDVEYLQNVFKRIAAKKLELVDDGSASASGGGGGANVNGGGMLGPQQRQEQFTAETAAWIATSLRKLEAEGASGKDGSSGEYLTARRIEYVRPIFESIWASAVVALSILLEGSEDAKVIELCLLGFRYGIHVAAAFYMETERSTFITALDKFTLLSNLREMRPKNIRAIRELVALAQAEGNYLRGSWFNVLRSVSLLERLHLARSGLGSDSVNVAPPRKSADGSGDGSNERAANANDDIDGWEIIGSDSASTGTTSVAAAAVPPTQHQVQATQAMVLPPGPARVVPQEAFTDQLSQVELLNSLAVGGLDVDVAFLDRIFSESAALSDNAIVDFVRALCDVSLSEVSSATPRIFSLQKIVEVAYYNMNNRTRFVWARIWVILREHFVRCGCHPLPIVSIYAIDSLRQLAMKYLEKAELASYNFQQEFLRPFETVINTTPSPDVADFVLNAVRQIVTARTANIASGWKTILAVLASCAHQNPHRAPALSKGTVRASELDDILDGSNNGGNTSNSNNTAATAYGILAEIAEKYHEYVIPKYVPEVVAAFVEFGKETSDPDIALRSVTALRICADRLWEAVPLRSVLPASSPVPARLSSSSSSSPALSSRSPSPAPAPVLSPVPVFPGAEEGEEEAALSTWFPILTGLAAVSSHPNAEVRNAALESLFGVLEEIGCALTPHMWALVLRGAVLPIFDNAGYARGVKAASSEALDQDWLDTSCSAALGALTALYVRYFSAMGPTLLGEVFGVVSAFLCQPYCVSLAGYAADALTKLLAACGPKFSRDMWDATFALIENFFAADAERNAKVFVNVISSSSSSSSSANNGSNTGSENGSRSGSRSNSMSSSLTSLPVVNMGEVEEHRVSESVGVTKKSALTVRDIVRTTIRAFEDAILQNYDKLGVPDVARILDALCACYDSACRILDTKEGCAALAAAGALEPYTAKAADVLGFYLRLGFRAYAGATQERDEQEVAGKVFPLCIAVLEQRAAVSKKKKEEEEEEEEGRKEEKERGRIRTGMQNENRQSGALLVLNSLLELDDNKYDAQYPSFYKMLVELVTDRSEDIRVAVAKHFSRIGMRLNIIVN